MTEGYTRGPWVAVRNELYWEIRSDHHGQIGDACASKYIHVGGECLPESETEIIAAANARLIAASPDLLAFAKAHDAHMAAHYSGPDSDALHPDAANNWRMCRAAIARAEGSAP